MVWEARGGIVVEIPSPRGSLTSVQRNGIASCRIKSAANLVALFDLSAAMLLSIFYFLVASVKERTDLPKSLHPHIWLVRVRAVNAAAGVAEGEVLTQGLLALLAGGGRAAVLLCGTTLSRVELVWVSLAWRLLDMAGHLLVLLLLLGGLGTERESVREGSD